MVFKGHLQIQITILLCSLWVGDDSKVSQSIILLTTTPSIVMRMPKNIHQNTHIATLLSMVPFPTPISVLLIHYRQILPGLGATASGVVLDVDRSTKIVKKLNLKGVPYKIF